MTPSAFRSLSDDDQAEMIAYITEICPSCGNLRSVCSDPERPFYPQRAVCYATAVKEVTVRRLRKLHSQDAAEALHPLDGLGVWASPDDLTPDDDFLNESPLHGFHQEQGSDGQPHQG